MYTRYRSYLYDHYQNLPISIQFYIRLSWILIRLVIALLFAQKGVQFVYQGF